jgi:RNA polymerase-binding transcription factor DksA
MKRQRRLGCLSTATVRRQLWNLLLERQRALCHEWRLSQRQARIDDDLLPASDRVEDALTEVNLAMARIASGAYGSCLGCGGGIDFERLLVLPTAARCWSCQQSSERAFEGLLAH